MLWDCPYWIQRTARDTKPFLEDLKARGITGVTCTTSDAHEGLKHAVREVYLTSSWQRCAVYPERDVISKGKTKEKCAQIAAVISKVFKGKDPDMVCGS